MTHSRIAIPHLDRGFHARRGRHQPHSIGGRLPAYRLSNCSVAAVAAGILQPDEKVRPAASRHFGLARALHEDLRHKGSSQRFFFRQSVDGSMPRTRAASSQRRGARQHALDVLALDLVER